MSADPTRAPLAPTFAASARRAAAALLLLVLAIACDSATAPPTLDPLAASQLTIVGGDDQVGAAGTTLPTPLAVRATDASGEPVEGVSLTWFVHRAGRVSSATSLTDSEGVARVERTLGPGAGEYVTRAALPELDGVRTEARFSSIALVQGALRMAGIERTRTDSVLATLSPYRVDVRDHLDQPVEGVRVDWALVSGSGALSTASSTTDAGGIAEAVHTLGPAVGNEVVRAIVTGLVGSPVTFGASVTAGNPASMVSVGGDGQLGKMDTQLSPYLVRVDDAHGNPVRGASVDWEVTSGGGSIDATSLTGVLGDARADHVLGSESTVQTATATLRGAPGIATLTFTATAVAELVSVTSAFYYGDFFSPASVHVPAGSTVGWVWTCFYYYYYYAYSCDPDRPHNVTFEDDPTEPTSSPTQVTGTHLRTFSTPGTYRYRSTNYSSSFTEGMVGVVTVF